MRRCVVAVLATLIVSMAAFAYTADLAAGLPHAAKPKTGYIGDTLRLRGLATVLDIVKVKVVEKKRLPAAGLLGVRLVIKNASTYYEEYWDSYPEYSDYVPKSAVLFDTKGRKYPVVRRATDEDGVRLPGQLGTVFLTKGESREGWVYFALKSGRWAKTFRFRPDEGSGYDTGKWTLKPRPGK